MYVYPFQIVFPIVSELLVSIQTHSSWKRLSEGPQKEERKILSCIVFFFCASRRTISKASIIALYLRDV
jgi:hypothetical protein